MADKQLDTGNVEVDVPQVVDTNETETTENVDTQVPEDKNNGGNDGGKKVEVPHWMPHRYNRMLEQKKKSNERIKELENQLTQGKMPNREDYGEDTDAYIDARIQAGQQKLAAESELNGLKSSLPQQENQVINEMFSEKLQHGRAKYPDWNAKLQAAGDMVIQPSTAKAVALHPAGEDALYSIASDPQIAAQVGMLPDKEQAAYINQVATYLQMQGNTGQQLQQQSPTQVQQTETITPEPTPQQIQQTRVQPTAQVSRKQKTPAQQSSNLHDFARNFNKERGKYGRR